MGGSSSEPVAQVTIPEQSFRCAMHEQDSPFSFHDSSSPFYGYSFPFLFGLHLARNRNLLLNPNASEGLSHWEVDNGGNGWEVVETDCCRVGASSQSKAFASSFDH
ncbi:uncharacterized protein LOC144783115 isoform X2 [Lissotriton helveticus]